MADEGTPHKERSAVRDAMVRFTVLSCVCLVIVGLLSVLIASTIARSLAAREAETRTGSFVDVLAAPLLDAETRADVAGSALGQALENRLKDRSVIHAALYDQGGRVIWSATPSAIGETETLDPEAQRLFESGGAISRYADELHAADEQGQEVAVLEVYAGGVGADGQPFLLEWYWPNTQLANNDRAVLTRLLPLTVGSLLIFQLMVLPLTLSTARRVEQERTRLTHHVMNASRLERRRLSEDLHDGVAQDLAAIGYVLPIVGKDIREGTQAHAMLAHIRGVLQRNISVVRGLIADIRPLDVRGDGFRAAMESLVLRMREHDVETTVTLAGETDGLPESARLLVLRVAREGLRNVVRHSGASHAWVDVEQQAHHVRVTVRDDGRGLSESDQPQPSPEDQDPHFGLELLCEALSDVDGTLDLRTGPDGGTELVVDFRTDRVMA